MTGDLQANPASGPYGPSPASAATAGSFVAARLFLPESQLPPVEREVTKEPLCFFPGSWKEAPPLCDF